MLICNPKKGRLETIEASMNEMNTTWFNDCQETSDIYAITDIEGDLLINENNFNHPVLIYNVTRADINHDQQLAKKLKEEAMSEECLCCLPTYRAIACCAQQNYNASLTCKRRVEIR